MLPFLGFGGGAQQLYSTKELKKVDMFVYTQPAGLLGYFIGRALRFRVERFSFTVVDGPDKAKSATGHAARRKLQRVEVEANTVVSQYEVNAQRFERLILTLSEVERIGRRTRGFTLDVPRHPVISFDVENETEEEIRGTLSLRGVSRPLTCQKVIDGAELVVTCPIKLDEYHVPRYKHLLGLFSVANNVDVVTRVPLQQLHL